MNGRNGRRDFDSLQTKAVILNPWVFDPSGIKLPFHRVCLRPVRNRYLN